MGLFERLRGELIDIVEWVDDSQHTLVWRFPRFQNEIKNGARLLVRPGQQALLVHEGRLADVFEPGLHTLATRNLPVLSTLQGWAHGFESPFKCEVYFVSTRQVTDLKWGTPNPVMLRDPDFGPIRLRAFGTYTLRATDPRALLTELVGTDGVYEADEVGELVRSAITSEFAAMIGQSGISALDLAARTRELSEELRQRVLVRLGATDAAPGAGGYQEFREGEKAPRYGITLPILFILNISFPEEVEQAIDRRSSMQMIGDMERYQQYQVGTALPIAAAQPGGGGMSEGVGLGMGLAMAGRFGAAGATPQGAMPAGTVSQAPPPLPTTPVYHVAEGSEVRGPIDHPTLLQWISAGRITATTLIWTPGQSTWCAAAQLPTLSPLFQAPPPPPAPAEED